MLNIMIDLESLALDDEALITQIGILIFDDHFLPCGELCVNIDITAALLDGFTVNPDTLKFWRGQNKDVVNSVMYAQPRLTPRIAAQMIDKWIKDTFKGEDFMIWANGLLFDIPKMDHLLTKYGLKPLTAHTRYSKIHDFRTLRNTTKNLYPEQYAHAESIIKNDSLHNALADCYWQLETLGAIMQILGGKYHMIGQAEEQLPVADFNLNEVHLVDMETNPDAQPANPADPDDGPSWDDEEEDPVVGEFFEHVYGETMGDSDKQMLAESPQPDFNRDNVDNT